MYARLFKPISTQGYFLFGSRGTGKTHLVHKAYPNAVYVDLL